MQEDCVFCKIVKGEIPAKKVYEDEKVLAFHDINPKAPVHVLIIPKKHIVNLGAAEDGDKEIIGQCQMICRKVAEKLDISDAFRVLTASGPPAGQSVLHLHYHLIGGWDKEAPEMEVKKEKFP